MGASLVKAAFEQFPDLPDVAMRALLHMAVTAKDNDETPTYWGGRDALASALGRSVVDLAAESTDGAGDVVAATYRAISRVIETLTVAKAISRTNRPAPGRNAVYRLHLSMERETPDDTRSQETHDAGRPPSGARRARPSMEHRTFGGSNTGRLVVRTQDAGRHPEEEVGRVGEKISGRTQLTGDTSSADDTTENSAGMSNDQPTATTRPLRVVASNPSLPVVKTTGPRQPALWPAAVPDHQEEDTVNAAEARQLARAALQGRSTTPITRAGRERQAAARGTWRPAKPGELNPGEGDTPPAINRASRKGFGFCLPCHDQGRITLASDPVAGSTCDRHAPAAVAS